MLNNQVISSIVSNVADITNVLNDKGIKLYTFDFRANYSNDLSQMYYDDFKSEIENQSLWMNSGDGIDYLVIFENEALKGAPYYKKSHLAKMKKQDLYDLCEHYDILSYYHSEWNYEDNTKQMLIDELMKYVNNEKFYTHHYNENSWHDLECSFVIRGYCQGDACKVLVVGKVESYINESYLTNIFYDSPIEGYVEISLNGELFSEFSFYDLDGFNQYNYFDKDKLISMITEYSINEEYSTLLIDYLKENVPTSLSYDY